MKCDELKAEQWLDYSGEPMPCYPKAKVDEAIAELKQKLEDAQATAYAESVDAGMRERRLRRLLWHAIALFCARSCEYFSGIMSHCLMGQEDLYNRCEEKKNKYLHAMYKCRAKACVQEPENPNRHWQARMGRGAWEKLLRDYVG